MKKNIFKKIGMVFMLGLLLGMMQACCLPCHYYGYEHPNHHSRDYYYPDNPYRNSPRPGPYR